MTINRKGRSPLGAFYRSPLGAYGLGTDDESLSFRNGLLVPSVSMKLRHDDGYLGVVTARESWTIAAHAIYPQGLAALLDAFFRVANGWETPVDGWIGASCDTLSGVADGDTPLVHPGWDRYHSGGTLDDKQFLIWWSGIVAGSMDAPMECALGRTDGRSGEADELAYGEGIDWTQDASGVTYTAWGTDIFSTLGGDEGPTNTGAILSVPAALVLFAPNLQGIGSARSRSKAFASFDLSSVNPTWPSPVVAGHSHVWRAVVTIRLERA